MKKFALDLVRGNLSFPWVFFILLSFIPIAIFFISWKLDLQNFPMIFGVYMFFASIIVLKTAMKNPNHYAQGLAILLSAVCLFVGGVVILGVLVVLIFSFFWNVRRLACRSRHYGREIHRKMGRYSLFKG